MMLRAPYTLSFILVVCCFRHNAAIPFASRSSEASRVRHAIKNKGVDSERYDIMVQSRASRKTQLSDDSFDNNYNASRVHNIIKNKNVNLNTNLNLLDRQRNEYLRLKGKHTINQQKIPKKDISFESYFKEKASEEAQSANCTSGKKANQRYSSSFVGLVNRAVTVDKEANRALTVDKKINRALTVDKDVLGNNSKAKTVSSVHEDEVITLCWIETTTIKENKTVRPSKKLVIREYTISFENSATIPDKYLECKKFEGELTTNDNKTGNTALFEVIDEDTKVSKVVNFTAVSHVGDVFIWQHKKVKCGVGPVVTKKVEEWKDGSKNPKKRVEIKVSPKVHHLTATSTEEEPCTESSVEEENAKSSKPTLNPDVITESCENGESGTCEVTTKSNVLKKNNTEVSISKETVTESSKDKTDSESESEEDLSMSTGNTEPPSEETFTSTIVPTVSITKEDILSCEENSSDPLCPTQKNVTSSSSKEELSTESEVTEATEVTTIPTVYKKVVTKTDISSKEELPKFSSESKEEKEVSEVITEEATEESTEEATEETTSTTKISIKSFVTIPENIDYDGSSVSTSKTSTTTSHGVTDDETKEKHLTSEEGESTSAELTSKELNKIDHVPSSSVSTITDQITTKEEVTITPYEFTEFVEESEKFSHILNKVSDASISTTESSNTFAFSTSSNIKPTVLSLTPSDRSENLCENSEDCASINNLESCEESENCGSVTDSQSSENLVSIEIQHTTVASVATTVLTAQETENNSTVINNVESTRRSTTTSTPQHKLTLKVKVFLEHINEKKEKHNLVEVEKHLTFDENSAQDDHFDLLEQLKSLNESVNRETLSALLNCTSLGNLTKKSNIINKRPNNGNSHKEVELTDPTVSEELISEQSTSEPDFVENQDFQYSEYDQENDRENEISSRRRRRRSLDDKEEDLGALDIVRSNLIDSDKSSVTANSLNVSEYVYLTKETAHPSTTTNNPEEETSNVTYSEDKKDLTNEGNDSIVFSTIKGNDSDSSTLEYQDLNVTKEKIQLFTTTDNPEKETSNTVRTESGNDTTTETVLSTVPSIKENKTKIDVVRQTLPGIQEDVLAGLQHVVSKLTQNLTSVNDIKKVVRTNLLSIIANPKDARIHSRVRRAAAEEVGHWSNERIKEAPMGGSLRSFTEFTLYKLLL